MVSFSSPIAPHRNMLWRLNFRHSDREFENCHSTKCSRVLKNLSGFVLTIVPDFGFLMSTNVNANIFKL